MDNDLKEYMLYEEEYRHFLKKYPDYTEDENSINMKFDYTVPKEYCESISNKYEIMKRIIRVEDEIRKIKKAMLWVSVKVVLSNNDSEKIVKQSNILEIMDEINREKKRTNCLKNARVMTQLLLCSGFKARTIICLPIGTFPYDNHCLTEVYINTYGKWIAIDPTYNLFFCDDNGDYMSIKNIRDAIVHNKKINPVFNKMYGISNKNSIQNVYLKYMTKNLFRFRTYKEQFDWNSKSDVMYELVPRNYTLNNYCIQESKYKIIFTTNEKKFWRG